MEYFLYCLKNYALFTGRARRKEYWMFALFQFLILIVAMFLDRMLGTDMGTGSGGAIYLLCALGLLIPSLAVSVRRLHDVGKSGWFMLILFIPLVGAIWLLVLCCTEGTHSENQYGPDPKAAELAY